MLTKYKCSSAPVNVGKQRVRMQWVRKGPATTNYKKNVPNNICLLPNRTPTWYAAAVVKDSSSMFSPNVKRAAQLLIRIGLGVG